MQVPEICRLNSDAAIQEIRKKAPFYVPEWNTEDENDFGIVLSNIFSGMAEIISSRLNEAPKKHFLSFLEMINTSLIPASSARVPLTFVLSEGTPDNVLIESSTQVSADGPDGKPVIFETETNILATPAKLVSVYSVIKEKDRIFDNTRAVDGVEPTELLTTGENLQKHILYIGDENLFNLGEGVITIDFGKIDKELLKKLVSKPTPCRFFCKATNLKKLFGKKSHIMRTKLHKPYKNSTSIYSKFITLPKTEHDCYVKWEYGVKVKGKKDGKEVEETKWLFLRSAVAEDRVEITKEILNFEGRKTESWVVISDKVKVNGIESRWIRCRVCENEIDEFEDLKLKGLNISVSPPIISPDCGSAIVPDFLFYNDIPIQMLDNSFYPFGRKPYVYDTFYIGSKDAFSKKGYNVTLTFCLRPGKSSSTSEADNPLLSWEYWDGESWNLLKIQDLECKNGDWVNLSESTKCKKSKGHQKKVQQNTVNLVISEMPEIKLAKVNGKENYWIRARLVGGNYGKEYEITYPKQNVKVMRGEVIPSTFCPPQITNLIINYKDKRDSNSKYKTKNGTVLGKQPEYVFSENNLVFRNCLDKLKDNIKENIYFRPFLPFPDILPGTSAIYFGFDKELKKGPISLFIDIDERIEFPKSYMPKIKWQYLTAKDPKVWKELEVLDETAGFTKEGMVQFNVSEKMQASRLFGLRDQYWIRAMGEFPAYKKEEKYLMSSNELKTYKKIRPKLYGSLPEKSKRIIENTELNVQTKNLESGISVMLECKKEFKFINPDFNKLKSREIPPKVLGFYLNSVWAFQYRTIYDEIIGSGRGETDQKFKLVNIPVTKEEIWVDEIDILSEKERKELLENPSNNIKSIQDYLGNTGEFWVRWAPVNDFLDSTSKDRHYTIDRTTGEVCFGDGKQGMIPPIGFNNVKATYRVGGGEFGNLGAKKILKLQSSIAFVDKVFNPSISDGGTKTEDIDSLLIRAPNVLKNRDRAIAAEDYEWLAKKASTKVAKVKALPNFNPVSETNSNSETDSNSKTNSNPEKFRTGYVTVAIVPESPDPKPVPSNELKRRVELHLKERCPPVMNLSVVSPSYVRTEVSAELVTNDINKIPIIEIEAKYIISEFLHPLRGSTEKKGWNFGCSLYISDIYSILEQIKDVDYVNKLTIDLYDDLEDSRVMRLSNACSMVKLPDYALPCSGEHEIIVDWKNSEKEG